MKPSQTVLNSRQEWKLLLTLSAIQFTQILDYVIMMPLGPIFMKAFGIGPTEFGWMLSSYTYAAAVFGLIGALLVDRFERKRALLFLYAGFAFGTFLCAVSPGHTFFIFSRILAGAFAGVMNPLVFSIIGDVIPAERRGAANGTVMSSFALASILGVPVGLFIANHFNWHMTFLFIVAVCVAVILLGMQALPTVSEHLKNPRPSTNLLLQIKTLLRAPNHRWSLLFVGTLVMGGFTIIPFVAAAFTSNAGVSETQLPYLYLVGGACTLLTSRLLGKFCDRFGSQLVFALISLTSIVPIFAVGYLGPVPLASVMALMALFMVIMSGRFIVGTTHIHNGVDPSQRGGFLSLMNSFQQLASGTASLVAGMIVTLEPETHRLLGMPKLAWVAGSFSCLAILVSFKIKPLLKRKDASAPIPAEVG